MVMRPLRDQTILITGSTDGLGRKVALDLAQQGATVLLHGRNPEKGKTVVREIGEATRNPGLRYYNADLASLDAVRRLAEEIQKEHTQLDVLINNAGIGARSREARRELSADGYELRFVVNYLSHFLLTYLLLPLMRKSAPARIVNVSSVGQQPLDMNDVMMERGYDDLRAYRQSKLAQVMFTFDLARELEGSEVTVNCLHPASLMNTKMVLRSSYFGDPLSTIEEGAEAVEYLAASPGLMDVSGEYFNGTQKARANAQAYDEETRRRLREVSFKLAGLELPKRRASRAA
jgi:NAD(P)-dependent dehydrogenase (short-subunit alcohol dehydrogenase family)